MAALSQDTPAAGSTPSPPSTPPDTTQPPTPKGEPTAAEQGASKNPVKKQAAGVPARKATKRRRAHKTVPKPAPGDPRRVVVREGGAREPSAQIVPGLAPQQANEERQSAVELLSSTDQNLKQLAGRTLDSRQLETVAQIHNYVEGARSALQDGDTQRAHTLALKAYLLADDLAKH